MNRKLILTSSIAVILFVSVAIVSSSAEENSIPSWIKNTAGWWSEGTVGDSEFISAMQWLASEGIISIPQDTDTKRIKNLESLVEQWETSYKKLEKESKQSGSDKRFLKKDFKFLMLQPENWEKQKVHTDSVEGNFVYSMIEASTFESFQPSEINVIIESIDGQSLRDYYNAEWNYYSPILSSYGKLDFIDSELTKVQGEEAISTIYTYEIQEAYTLDLIPMDVKLKAKSIVVEHKDEGYTITFISTEENFDGHVLEFDEIMETFRFL